MVERVAVIFLRADNVPLEKFVIKLAVNQTYGSKVEEADLELSLRSLLIKLLVSESVTKNLSPDCKWEISVYFGSLPEGGTISNNYGSQLTQSSGNNPYFQPLSSQ